MIVGLLACGGAGEAGSGVDETPEAERAAPDPNALVGDWQLVAIVLEGGDEMVPVGEALPTLSFTAEADPTGSRRFGGSGGCNRIMGGYDAGRTGRLAISRGPAMTMMACPDPVMSLEQAFVAALESASAYAIEGNGLSIHFDGGVLRLEHVEG
jgi:heat shock protein HslJ